MRTRYFSMYHNIKYKECFYSVHQKYANAKLQWYMIIMTAVSILSVLAWGLSKRLPAIWGIIIASAQFAQVLSSYLLWQKQLVALKFLMPQLAILCLDIDSDWMNIDIEHYDDRKLHDLIAKYELRFSTLEAQFRGDISFPEKNYILDEAEKDQRNYFYSRYPIIKELEGREK